MNSLGDLQADGSMNAAASDTLSSAYDALFLMVRIVLCYLLLTQFMTLVYYGRRKMSVMERINRKYYQSYIEVLSGFTAEDQITMQLTLQNTFRNTLTPLFIKKKKINNNKKVNICTQNNLYYDPKVQEETQTQNQSVDQSASFIAL